MKLEPILPNHIDSSMLTTARSCMQKFKIEYIYGLRPAGARIDLHAGGVFAKSLEYFQRQVHEKKLPVAEALNRATSIFIREWGDVETPFKNPKTLDNMILAMHDYVRVYPPGTDHVQPYTGLDGDTTYEFSFAIPLDFPGFPVHPVTGEPYVYCGRFDLLGTYQGRPCIRDEKTAKQAGEKWAEQWDLRAQFMGYVWGARMSGIEDIETVVVRGVIIQKTQIRQLEAIKIFPNFMIDRWFEQLRRDLIRITEAWKADYFDWNFGDSCSSYGGCSFTGVCSAADPTQWLGDYVVNRWNPLQHNPIADLETPST